MILNPIQQNLEKTFIETVKPLGFLPNKDYFTFAGQLPRGDKMIIPKANQLFAKIVALVGSENPEKYIEPYFPKENPRFVEYFSYERIGGGTVLLTSNEKVTEEAINFIENNNDSNLTEELKDFYEIMEEFNILSIKQMKEDSVGVFYQFAPVRDYYKPIALKGKNVTRKEVEDVLEKTYQRCLHFDHETIRTKKSNGLCFSIRPNSILFNKPKKIEEKNGHEVLNDHKPLFVPNISIPIEQQEEEVVEKEESGLEISEDVVKSFLNLLFKNNNITDIAQKLEAVLESVEGYKSTTTLKKDFVDKLLEKGCFVFNNNPHCDFLKKQNMVATKEEILEEIYNILS